MSISLGSDEGDMGDGDHKKWNSNNYTVQNSTNDNFIKAHRLHIMELESIFVTEKNGSQENI